MILDRSHPRKPPTASRGRRSLGAVTYFALLFLAFGSALAGEFSRPANTIGFANCYGELQFSTDLGEIRLSQSETFPFSLIYSSWEEAWSPILGRGFWIPALEGYCIDHDYFLEMTTLGGARVFLYQVAQSPSDYVSLDGRQRAKRLGDSSFARRSFDGFTVTYRNGNLEEFTSPAGARAVVESQDGTPRTLRSSAGGSAIAIASAGETQRRITTHRGAFLVDLADLDLRSDEEKDRDAETQRIADLSVASITWPDGKKTSFDYTVPAKGSYWVGLKMTYDSDSMAFKWLPGSGALIEADLVSYRVGPIPRQVDTTAERIRAGTWTVTRTFPDGSWRSYTHDEERGIIDEEVSNRSMTRTHLVTSRGPAYYRVKKQERALPLEATTNSVFGGGGPTMETIYRAFYDDKGRLLREIDESKVALYFYHDSELDPALATSADRVYRYDERERLIYRDIEGIKTRLQHLGNGSSREVTWYPWGEIMLQYFAADGAPLPLPPNDGFPERNRPLPSSH